MAKKPEKPDAVVVGEIHARPYRGPSKRDPRWYWRAEVYEDGKARTVTSGRYSRDELITELATLRATGKHRGDRTQSQPIDNIEMLVRYWVAAQKKRGDLEPSSKASYERHGRRLKKSIGHVRLDRVDGRALEGHRDRTLAAGGAARTVRQDLRILGMAWRWGHSLGACDRETLPKITLNVVAVRSTYTPTPGDVATLIRAIAEHISRNADWPAWGMRIEWATGMRVGEVAALRVRHLELDRCRILVEHTKTHRVRHVSIRKEFAAELRPLVAGKHPDARLWPVSPSRFRVRVNEILRDLCAKAELRHWSSHGFRRAAVTRWLDSGAGIKAGAKQFGHSVETMIRVYQSLTESSLHDGAANAALDWLPEGEVVDLEQRRPVPS